MTTSVDYETRNPDDLRKLKGRDIREHVVSRLKERMRESGYNPGKPLRVGVKDNEEVVAGGRHRLTAAQELNLDEVPVVIDEDTDVTKIAVTDNQDETTYAPQDLFDWLELIENLLKEGHTQQEIGDKIGWARTRVSNYKKVTDKIVTQVLEMAKKHQEGRVTENVTDVTFNFTEGWFRKSGLYELKCDGDDQLLQDKGEYYQKEMVERFIEKGANWSNSKVKKEADKYRKRLDWIEYAKENLHNTSMLADVINQIESGTFSSKMSLKERIGSLNKKAQNKLINGDAVSAISDLPDDTNIDIVITDPPYGIDYQSNRPKYDDQVTAQGLYGDEDLDEAMQLTDDVLTVLLDKTAQDTHFYIFTSWKTYPELLSTIPDELSVKNAIIWDKKNHGAGDLKEAWGNRYEMIIFATKGGRQLNRRKQDIIKAGKLATGDMVHPTEKPVPVITELLDASAKKSDVVCDPFMGSGSTIQAVKDHEKDMNYIGIEIDDEMFDKAKSRING